MKKIILLVFVCAGSIAYAQEKHAIWGAGGYYLDTCRAGEGDGKEISRWYNNQYAFLNLNYRYLNILDAAGDFKLLLTPSDSNENLWADVQELAVRVSPADTLNMAFGKQRLKWGTAKVFNAIDKLEDAIDPFAVRQVRSGVSGIKAEYLPTEWMSCSLVMIPQDELRWTRFAGRLDLLLLDTDIGLGAIKYNYDHLISVASDNVQTNTSDRCAGFFDIKRYFDSLGIYGEFEYRKGRDKEYAFYNGTTYDIFNHDCAYRPVCRLTAGADFLIKIAGRSDMQLLAEYFFNSEGYSHHEARDFCAQYNNHSNYNASSGQNMPMILPPDFLRFGTFGKHYFYICLSGIEILYNRIWTGFSTTGNAETRACDFRPQVNFKVDNLVFIDIVYNYYHQFKNSEKYPSELNFYDIDQSVALYVHASF